MTKDSLGWGVISIVAESLADLERSPDTTTCGRRAIFRSFKATAVPEIDEDLGLLGVLEARSQDVLFTCRRMTLKTEWRASVDRTSSARSRPCAKDYRTATLQPVNVYLAHWKIASQDRTRTFHDKSTWQYMWHDVESHQANDFHKDLKIS